MSAYPLYCSDVIKPLKPGFLPHVCCDSCHDDIHELGSEYYLELKIYGNVALVCCGVANERDRREKFGST